MKLNLAGIFIFATAIGGIFALNAKAQDDGSILVRAKHSNLIIHGEVVGITKPNVLCGLPLLCQVAVLRVTEVIKGTYTPKYIRVWYNFAGFERFTQKSDDYVGLNRYLFDKGKKWILMLDDSQTSDKIPFITDELQKYKDVTCIKGSLDSSIFVDNDEELALMKQFINSFDHDDSCDYWQAKVDADIKISDNPAGITNFDNETKYNNETVLQAIGCLLKLKENKNSSKFPYAGVSFTLSERIPSPSVEVAALYFISYLYSQKWFHSRAMVLLDEKGNRNTDDSIKKAFKAYELWFKKVKEIGLKKARKQKLDPLNGSGVMWY